MSGYGESGSLSLEEFPALDQRLPASVARHLSHLQKVTASIRHAEFSESFRDGAAGADHVIALCAQLRRVLGEEVRHLEKQELHAYCQVRLILDGPVQHMRRLCSDFGSSEERLFIDQALQDFSLGWEREEKLRAFALLRLYCHAFEIESAPSAEGIEDPQTLRSYLEFLLEPPHFVRPGDRSRYSAHLLRTAEFLIAFSTGSAPSSLRSVAAQVAIDGFSVLLALYEGQPALPVSLARMRLAGELSRLSGITAEATSARNANEPPRVGLLTRSLWPTRSNRLMLPMAEALRQFGAETALITLDEAYSYVHDVTFSQRLFAAVDSIVRLVGPPQDIRDNLDALKLDCLVIATERGQTDAAALDFALAVAPVAKAQLALGAGLPGSAVPVATHYLSNADCADTKPEAAGRPLPLPEPLVPEPLTPPEAPLPILDAEALGADPAHGLILTVIEDWQFCADQVAFWEHLLSAVPNTQMVIVETGVWRAKPIHYRIPLGMRLALLVRDDALRARLIVPPGRRCFPRLVQRLMQQADVYLEPLFFGQNSALADAVSNGCIPAVMANGDDFDAHQVALLKKLGLQACVHSGTEKCVEAVSAVMRDADGRVALRNAIQEVWSRTQPTLSTGLRNAFLEVLPRLLGGGKANLAKEVA